MRAHARACRRGYSGSRACLHGAIHERCRGDHVSTGGAAGQPHEFPQGGAGAGGASVFPQGGGGGVGGPHHSGDPMVAGGGGGTTTPTHRYIYIYIYVYIG